MTDQMDVRCESCGTEYELDDSKLKKGAVTVKCANCGHMFKVRMKPEGAPATPPRGAPTGRGTMPAPYPLADRTPPPSEPPAPPAPSPGAAGDSKTWMVKT